MNSTTLIAILFIIIALTISNLEVYAYKYNRYCYIKPIYSHFLAQHNKNKVLHCNIESGSAPINRFQQQFKKSLNEFKLNPLKFLSIPLVAAMVGYVTNWLGVQMLFYPINWRGIPLVVIPNQPLGLIGWQGVVPCKRYIMTNRMVDVTISKLLSISAVFEQLDPNKLSTILTNSLSKKLFKGWIPTVLLKFYCKIISIDMIKNIESLINIKSIVVQGMCQKPDTLGRFFQQVADKELKFLVNSGTYFGFLLGLIQMLQWMIFPYNWTLPVGGTIVGLITNWIALKWIFEPLNPIPIGPFTLQGMFLKRQLEVSNAFCTYLSTHTLTSVELWKSILSKDHIQPFQSLIHRNLPPIVSNWMTSSITKELKLQLITESNHLRHPIHQYIDKTLKLNTVLMDRMKKMTPKEFEQVLHPIFQEDELTLILAGGALGLLAGIGQWVINHRIDTKNKLEEIDSKDTVVPKLI